MSENESKAIENEVKSMENEKTEDNNKKNSEVKNTEKNKTKEEIFKENLPAEWEAERVQMSDKIRKLIEENKERRIESESVKERHSQLEKKIDEMRSQHQKKLINTELKLNAQKLGLIDVDDAKKLLDVSNIKISDDGEVSGIAEALETLKTQKPYLFKNVTTSAGFSPARSNASAREDVMNMTPEEFASVKRKMLGFE